MIQALLTGGPGGQQQQQKQSAEHSKTVVSQGSKKTACK
jgi:hypothetical protein